MRKRIWCLLISLLLLCCAVSAAGAEVLPGKEIESGYYVYAVQDDGTAIITRYTGKDVEVRIPETLDDIAVTAIGPSAPSAFRQSVVASTSSDGSTP